MVLVVVVVMVVVVLTVCINDVSVDIIKRVQIIMGAVSLWTRPPALYRALKTHPISSSPP